MLVLCESHITDGTVGKLSMLLRRLATRLQNGMIVGGDEPFVIQRFSLPFASVARKGVITIFFLASDGKAG